RRMRHAGLGTRMEGNWLSHCQRERLTRRRELTMFRKHTVTAMLALSLAMAGTASPALAKQRAARAGFEANAQAIGGELAARTGQRAAALRECNQKVEPLKDYTWGEEQTDRYRACMAERGQPE